MEIRARVVEIDVIEYEDEIPDLSHLKITPEGHYGIDGSEWKGVSEESKSEVIKKYGSIWNACVEYAKQDKERLDAFHRGEWKMLCIMASAKIQIPTGNGLISQIIQSGTMCGIESDSSEEHVLGLEDEEIEEVKGYLKILNVEGIDNCQINRKRQKASSKVKRGDQI